MSNKQRQKCGFPTTSDRVIRLPEVTHLTGFSKPTIYRLMPLGEFPKAKKLGPRAVGWLESDIIEWMDSLKTA